ncbi:Iqg1 protein [Martiniozyma asiatica (nom. inval.)]|nr:Iqg1 protein [Martiniozyma asiatica]
MASPSRNLAADYLKKIAAVDDDMPLLSHVRTPNNYSRDPSPFPSPTKQQMPLKEYGLLSKKLSEAPLLPNETSSPIKNSEKPLNSVQKLIQAKEREAKSNNTINFTPRPDKLVTNNRKNIFLPNDDLLLPKFTSLKLNNADHELEKLSKSEMGRMGQINNAMSSSPSMKKLNIFKQQLGSASNVKSLAPISSSNIPPIIKSGITKTFSSKILNNENGSTSIAVKNWIDSNRDNMKLAAFVCRMIEIKRWVELVLGESIGLSDGDIDQFPDYLTNGVLVLRVAQKFNPAIVKKIWTPNGYNKFDDIPTIYKMNKKKEFKCTENIVQFLSFTKTVKLPSLFIFETNDLYESMDIPKVIASLHALACMMALLNLAPAVEKITQEGLSQLTNEHGHSLDIDKLKGIRYSIGKLGGKYIEGFEEAVRVNVGDDIRKLKLVSVYDSSAAEVAQSKKISTSLEATQDTVKLSLDKQPPSYQGLPSSASNDSTSTLTATALDKISEERDSSVDQDVNEEHDHSEAQIFDDESDDGTIFQQVEDARRARAFFNAPSSRFEALPKLESITGIHNKYKYLLADDERNLLSGSVLSAFGLASNIIDENILTAEQVQAITGFQSLARGYLLRFDLFVAKFMLKTHTRQIIEFQSLCRGKLSRKKQQNSLEEVDSFYGSSQMMKTLYRNKTIQSKLLKSNKVMDAHLNEIIHIQSIIRGKKNRDKYWHIRKHLIRYFKPIVALQSMIRGKNYRSAYKTIVDTPHLITPKLSYPYSDTGDDSGIFESFSSTVPSLSSHLTDSFPTKLETRAEIKKKQAKLTPNLPLSPSEIQGLRITSNGPDKKSSRISSRLHHSPTKKSLSSFYKNGQDLEASEFSMSSTILNFEPIRIEESNIKSSDSKECNDVIAQLQAAYRGKMVRFAYHHLQTALANETEKISTFLAVYRGVELRFKLDCIKLDLKDQSEPIKYLQSKIRGFRLRQSLKDRQSWFERPENITKIIKLQRFIKAKGRKENFKALIEQPSPPFIAVKNYISVLAGIQGEKIIQDSLDILKMREEAKVEKRKNQEEIEKLKYLKAKIDLLRRNGVNISINPKNFGVTIDELNFNTMGEKILNMAKEQETLWNNEIIKKTQKECIDVFSRFFSILQCQPDYWSSVLVGLDISKADVKFSHGFIEDWVLKSFNFDSHDHSPIENNTSEERNEILLMKLIVKTCEIYLHELNIDDFKLYVKNRRNIDWDRNSWELVLNAYLMLPKQRSFAKKHFAEKMLFLITADDEADFQCDPKEIHQKLIFEGKLETRTVNDPIEIPAVENIYVQNLTSLRNVTYELFKKLQSSVDDIPIYLRYIVRELYEIVKKQFPTLSETYWLGFAASALIKDFIAPMFIKPANYSVDVFALGNITQAMRIQQNLDLVAIMLTQCVLMRPFSSSQQPYLIPLNPFIAELNAEMKDWIYEIMNVRSLDIEFQTCLLIDSTLRIKADDIKEVVNVWSQFADSFFEDAGILQEVLDDLSNITANKSKLSIDKYGYANIPILNDENNDLGISIDSKLKALWLELKKYLILILQVQSGDNLTDVLMSGVTPADEMKYLKLVRSETEMLKKNGIIIDDVYSIPYPLIKERAICLLIELEELGEVESYNDFQEVTNALAKDIRHKRKEREDREFEKQKVIDALTLLKKKSRNYSKVYKDSENKLNDELTNLLRVHVQSKSGEFDGRSSLISKLFRRSAKSNKRNSGSLYGQRTYPLKTLLDKQIIKSMPDEFLRSTFSLSGKLMLILSCQKPNEFRIELSNEPMGETVTLNHLLEWEWEGRKELKLFGGNFIFDIDKFRRLIIDGFYK